MVNHQAELAVYKYLDDVNQGKKSMSQEVMDTIAMTSKMLCIANSTTREMKLLVLECLT